MSDEVEIDEAPSEVCAQCYGDIMSGNEYEDDEHMFCCKHCRDKFYGDEDDP